MPDQEPMESKYHDIHGGLKDATFTYKAKFRNNSRWQHMADNVFIVWDENDRVRAWMEHLLHHNIEEENIPYVL